MRGESIFHRTYVVVRQRGRFGLFGTLACVPVAHAVRLVRDRQAKLPAELTLRHLELHARGLGIEA